MSAEVIEGGGAGAFSREAGALVPTLLAAGLAEGPLPEAAARAPQEAFDREEMALFATGSWTWFPLEPWDEVA